MLNLTFRKFAFVAMSSEDLELLIKNNSRFQELDSNLWFNLHQKLSNRFDKFDKEQLSNLIRATGYAYDIQREFGDGVLTAWIDKYCNDQLKYLC